ncbi:hypothetical protein [Luteipulveratus halotolerans]|uniref:hypothetical protein n=1 Tax=Luteipulveratus halotolerans TaxID=1631356 RepID=UPI0012FA1FFA|nr:hypothetical protein [Luteipulveratus halotolerans]
MLVARNLDVVEGLALGEERCATPRLLAGQTDGHEVEARARHPQPAVAGELEGCPVFSRLSVGHHDRRACLSWVLVDELEQLVDCLGIVAAVQQEEACCPHVVVGLARASLRNLDTCRVGALDHLDRVGNCLGAAPADDSW